MMRGGDSWGTIAAADVTKVDNDSAGLSLALEEHFGSAVAFDGDRNASDGGRLLAVGGVRGCHQ